MVTSDRNTATVDYLKLSPYFAGLDDCLLEKISRLITERTVGKHEIIWLEQESAKMAYFVASGLIKLFKVSAEGKEQILRLVRPGGCFGYPGMFNGGSNPENAQALVPSMLYGLMKRDLEALLREDEQLALNTIRALATETHHYMSLVEDLSLRRVNSRLAKMLLEHSGEEAGDPSPILTQADMAAMIGTVREVVGKSVKALEDEGAIIADRRSIIIKDSGALRRMAGLV
jgi:CRP-like cAMP-binding protein